MEHKIATYGHHITRMHSLPPKRKQREWILIKLIAQNNNFQQKTYTKSKPANTTQKTNQDQSKGKEIKTKNGQPSHTTVQE
jgi:hypothetical protein